MALTRAELDAYTARITQQLRWFAKVRDRVIERGADDTEVYRRTEAVREALYELWKVTKPHEGPTSGDVSSGPMPRIVDPAPYVSKRRARRRCSL